MEDLEACLSSIAVWMASVEWRTPTQLDGDSVHALVRNDAVNVAVTCALDVHDGFKSKERRERPGVEKSSAALTELLEGRDRALVPVFRERADEGFLATERAYAATADLADPSSRGAAMQQWMKDNGFRDRPGTDVAFAKGSEYFVWLQGQSKASGVDAEAEIQRVHDRAAPLRAFACRG